MRTFKRGKTPNELNIPVYTTWDDFVADEVDPESEFDNSELQDLYPVDPALVKKHLEEK